MTPRVDIHYKELAQFCRRWGIEELSLFGSVLRDDFSDASDVDVLVAFSPQSHPTLFDLVTMQGELSRLFERRVDLVSRRGIERSGNYIRRNAILPTAQSVYAAAA